MGNGQGYWNYKKIERCVVLLLLLLVVLVFFPSLSNGFVEWDDPANFLNNTAFHGLSGDHLLEMLTCTVQAIYQPLSWFIFALIYQVSELNPFGYHLAGLVFHAANTVLVYFLIKRLCSPGASPGKSSQPGATVLQLSAFFAAALYGLHPLRAEVVAWASGVPYTFATFFVLISVLCYLKYAAAGGGQKSYLIFSWATYVVALLCKPIALPLVFVLLLLDFYPLKRLKLERLQDAVRSNGRVWFEKVPFFLIAVIFGVIALIAKGTHYEAVRAVSGDIFLLSDLGKMFYSIAFHLKLTLSPTPLMPHYAWPKDISTLNWMFLVLGGVVIGLTLLVYRRKTKWPAFFVAWFAYLMLILPHSDVISHGYAVGADRYTYISTLPFYVLFASGVMLVLSCGRLRRWLKCLLMLFICGTMLVPLAVATRRRVQVWHDSFSLWGDVLRKRPDSNMAYDNLGFAYAREDRVEAARLCFYKSLAFDPDDAKALANLGRIHLHEENYELALRYHLIAVDKNPRLYTPYVHIAKAYANLGQLEQAAVWFEKAIELNPWARGAYVDCAHVYVKLKEYRKAIAHYRRAVSLGEGDARLYFNVGTLYKNTGDFGRAIRFYRQSLEMDPSFAEAWNNLGSLYARGGRAEAAAECFRKAIGIRPGYEAALLNMGKVQEELGNMDAARRYYERAGGEKTENK